MFFYYYYYYLNGPDQKRVKPMRIYSFTNKISITSRNERKRQALRYSSVYRPGQISYVNWLQLILWAALTLPRVLNSCEDLLVVLPAEKSLTKRGN